MNKKTVGLLLFSFSVVIITGLILLIIYKEEAEITFYAKIQEVNDSSYLVVPFSNEKIAKTYDIISVSLDSGLQIDDIVKITGKTEVLEIYPPVLSVISYQLISTNVKEVEETTSIFKETTTTYQSQITTTEAINTEIPNVEEITTEEDVIKEIEFYIASASTDAKVDNTLGDKLKGYFITVTDFIFYDQPLAGYKFKDLTNSAKLKVINLTLSLDKAVDKKIPNYKNTLSTNYQNGKNTLIIKYLELTTEFCQNKSEICTEAKEGFKTIKTNLNLTWSFIKDIATVGVKELQVWYEIFSGK